MTLILSMLTFLWFTWAFTSQQKVEIRVSVAQEEDAGASSSAPAGSAVPWHAGPATFPHRRHTCFSMLFHLFHSVNGAKFHYLYKVNLVFSSAQVYCFLKVTKVFTLRVC